MLVCSPLSSLVVVQQPLSLSLGVPSLSSFRLAAGSGISNTPATGRPAGTRLYPLPLFRLPVSPFRERAFPRRCQLVFYGGCEDGNGSVKKAGMYMIQKICEPSVDMWMHR